MTPQQATRKGLLQRRTFLKATLSASALGVAASAGLLKPTGILAAEWPKNAFDAKSINDALTGLYGTSASTASGSAEIKAQTTTSAGHAVPATFSASTASGSIEIKTFTRVENGVAVPIAVSANLLNVQGIAVFVEKNAQPLVASIALNGAEGYFSTRMNMCQTSNVHVVCKAGGRLYSTKLIIKVAGGDCGG